MDRLDAIETNLATALSLLQDTRESSRSNSQTLRELVSPTLERIEDWLARVEQKADNAQRELNEYRGALRATRISGGVLMGLLALVEALIAFLSLHGGH